MSDAQLASEVVQKLLHLIEQAVAKIEHCVNQLSDEQIWSNPGGVVNSIGNLVLHISGNLKQWGVVPLTGDPDLREREKEFTHCEVIPSQSLLSVMHEVVAECQKLWPTCDSNQLLENKVIQGFDNTTYEALLHTSAHFVGHSHQIIMITRMILGDNYRFHWTPDLPRDQVPI